MYIITFYIQLKESRQLMMTKTHETIGRKEIYLDPASFKCRKLHGKYCLYSIKTNKFCPEELFGFDRTDGLRVWIKLEADEPQAENINSPYSKFTSFMENLAK